MTRARTESRRGNVVSDDGLKDVRRRAERPSSQQPVTRATAQDEQMPERPGREIDPATGKEVYYAYKGGPRKTNRLEIRRTGQEWRAPSYRYLMEVSFNGHRQTEIVLIFTFYRVIITGKNLDPIIYAVEDDRCEWIQEYDAEKFTIASPNQPIIDKIEFVMQVMHVCPRCKTSAMAKSDARLLCGNCKIPLILKENNG